MLQPRAWAGSMAPCKLDGITRGRDYLRSSGSCLLTCLYFPAAVSTGGKMYAGGGDFGGEGKKQPCDMKLVRIVEKISGFAGGLSWARALPGLGGPAARGKEERLSQFYISSADPLSQGSWPGAGRPVQGEQCRRLGTCSVSQQQGWSCVQAALLRAGCGPQICGCIGSCGVGIGTQNGGNCTQSCGETVICARGWKKGHFLPIFSFEDVSPQPCPGRWPSNAAGCFGGICFESRSS